MNNKTLLKFFSFFLNDFNFKMDYSRKKKSKTSASGYKISRDLKKWQVEFPGDI